MNRFLLSCFKQTVKKFIRFIYLLPTALISFSENIYIHTLLIQESIRSKMMMMRE